MGRARGAAPYCTKCTVWGVVSLTRPLPHPTLPRRLRLDTRACRARPWSPRLQILDPPLAVLEGSLDISFAKPFYQTAALLDYIEDVVDALTVDFPGATVVGYWPATSTHSTIQT